MMLIDPRRRASSSSSAIANDTRSPGGSVGSGSPRTHAAASAAVYGSGTAVQRGISGSLHASTSWDALDSPAAALMVASDGSADDTVARAAGADLVLDLPRGGKIRAQDAAVERASGDIVAFSDANSFWEAGALQPLGAPFAGPKIGYVC